MDRIEIRNRVLKIIDDIVGDILPDSGDLSGNEKLNIILSESMQALIFVTSLEDEFAIQFDDDQIDLEFFQDMDCIVAKIQSQSLNAEPKFDNSI